MPEIELSYCVVNTSQRELLLRGLDAIAREREALPFATEVLVLDNGSRDGSAQAAREHPAVDEMIALDERRGKALNDSELLRRARGRYALLLNEDSELRPGATLALWQALQERPRRGLRGRAAAAPGRPRAGLRVALSDRRHGARRRTDAAPPATWSRAPARTRARSTGASPRHCSCGARRPPQRGLPRPRLLRVLRRGRLRPPPARRRLAQRVRAARRWPSTTSSSSTGAVPERRIVELARGRDLYMRKHHSAAAARAVRWLTAWSYALRALAALALPGHDPAALLAPRRRDAAPARGEGLREAADAVQPRG